MGVFVGAARFCDGKVAFLPFVASLPHEDEDGDNNVTEEAERGHDHHCATEPGITRTVAGRKLLRFPEPEIPGASLPSGSDALSLMSPLQNIPDGPEITKNRQRDKNYYYHGVSQTTTKAF